MKPTTSLEKKLLSKIRKMNKEVAVYNRASDSARAKKDFYPNALFDANRYEGIATAYRWVAEDLKSLLK